MRKREVKAVSEPFRVIIADDELISRGYMEMFIQPSPRYEIAASLPRAQDVVDWCRKNGPADLAVMDIMMKSGMDGLTAAGILKKEFPGMKIIMATSALEQSWWEQARDIGVESFWYKAYAKLSLLEIMDRTMDGEHVYTNEDRDAMLGDLPVSELTNQQRNVLRELTRGRNNREIGERLCIEESTVRYHLEEIMRKAGIHSRVELAVKASRANIVVSDEDRLNGMGG